MPSKGSKKRDVWYRLLDGDGERIVQDDRVRCFVQSNVVSFRDAVIDRHSRSTNLEGLAGSNLIVYATDAAWKACTSLEAHESISKYGTDATTFMVVVAPQQARKRKFDPSITIDAMESLCVPEEELELHNYSLSEKTAKVATPALSELWKSYGGFPSAYVMRLEERLCWSEFEKMLRRENPRIALIGSPGVGKSTLMLLAALRLAIVEKKKVLVLRHMGGGEECHAVYFDGGGNFGCCTVRDKREAQDLQKYPEFEDAIKFLDGFLQADIDSFSLKYHALATSCQYEIKSSSTCRLVVLPAWRLEELDEFARFTEIFGPVTSTKSYSKMVKSKYYSSGGSLREFCKDGEDLARSLGNLRRRIAEKKAFDLVTQVRGGGSKYQVDSLRRHFVVDRRNQSHYTDTEKWLVFADIPCLVQEYAALVPANQQLELYRSAKRIGGGFFGTAFELTLHRAVHECAALQKEVVIQARGGSKYEKLCIRAPVICTKGADLESSYTALELISRETYWHPTYPNFPFVDAIALCDAYTQGVEKSEKVLAYLQVTVAKTKRFRQDHLQRLNERIDKNATLSEYKSPLKRMFVIVTDNEATCDSFQLSDAPTNDKCPSVIGFFDVEDFFKVTPCFATWLQ